MIAEWPDEPTMLGDDAPPVAPPSSDEGTRSIAPPPADSPPGGSAADARAQGTHLAVAPGATLPDDATAASPIDRLEFSCLAIEPHTAEGELPVIHAFGYDTEGDAWTVCGQPCGPWPVQVGGLPTCGPCSLGRAVL